MVCCSVVGCGNTQKSVGVSFFRFPTSSLGSSWIESCGQSPPNITSGRICSQHFSADDFCVTPKGRRLSPNAVPSRNLPPRPTHEVNVRLHKGQSETTVFVVLAEKVIRIRVAKVKEDETPKGSEIVATPINYHLGQMSSSGSRYEIHAADDDTIQKLKARVSTLKKEVSHFKGRSRKNRDEKQQLKTLNTVRIVKHRASMTRLRSSMNEAHRKQQQLLKQQLTMMHDAVSKIFTKTQLKVLLRNQSKTHWNEEDIGKGISLRYKSNLYEYLRELGFPFPSTRTLQRWTQRINFAPGILHSVLNLLRAEFENAPEISRQCCLAFDEMHLDGSFAYDAQEDKLYGPSSNINVYYLRGLFAPWKQPVAFEFDDDLTPGGLLSIIGAVEDAGLKVKALTCDLGGKNRGLLRDLGVKVEKVPQQNQFRIVSSFSNPRRPEEFIYVFPDAPHLLKLLRDNLFKHGLKLNEQVTLTKSDLETLVVLDSSELQSHRRLTPSHLDVKGLDKTRVYLAAQLFSSTTATLYRKVFPNRIMQADFIQLTNDWFDLMNSRNVKELRPSKKPFGTDHLAQLELLERMERSIAKLRVGNSKSLYPFQRGILLSTSSMRHLFDELTTSPLRISYILTHRLNQDLAENGFSVIRKTGGFHSKPTAVDAKRRLKLLCLSWGSSNLKTSAVQQEEGEPFLSSRMIHSLTSESSPEIEIPEVVLPEEAPDFRTLNEENVEVVLQSLGPIQSCEWGGMEYVSGFVSKKFSAKHPMLSASEEELRIMERFSWVKSLKKEWLRVPSMQWLNWCSILEKEFQHYHLVGGRFHLNKDPGVLKGLSKSLCLKYPEIPSGPLCLYIKTRLFVRIKRANSMLREERSKAAQARLRRWLQVNPGRSPPEDPEEVSEDEDDIRAGMEED